MSEPKYAIGQFVHVLSPLWIPNARYGIVAQQRFREGDPDTWIYQVSPGAGWWREDMLEASTLSEIEAAEQAETTEANAAWNRLLDAMRNRAEDAERETAYWKARAEQAEARAERIAHSRRTT